MSQSIDPVVSAMGHVGQELRKLLLENNRPSVWLAPKQELSVFTVLYPELAALVGVQQEPRWHPEGDVWTHTLMAVDVAADIVRREGLEEDDALVILLGALCHDFGKPVATQFRDGHWRAWGHHEEGVAPTRRFLSRMEFGESIKERVVHLVEEHMFLGMRNGTRTTDRAIRRLSVRLVPATIQELVWVMEADLSGRGILPGERLLASGDLLRRARAMGIALTRSVHKYSGSI